jgi:DNA-directed RNA polymerase subunit RPC12/RpoP
MIQTQRLEQQCLTLQQRQFILSQELTTRIALVAELRNERYEPKAICPKCNRKLEVIEIVSGFNQDPNDFTTRCPKCRHRFPAKLICYGEYSNSELPFYCAEQTTAQLKNMSDQSPDYINKEMPAVYRSAVIHFGSLASAFQSVDIQYNFTDTRDWQQKVIPFLGMIPDAMIANCAGTSPFKIRSLRKKFGIPKYSKRKILEDLE